MPHNCDECGETFDTLSSLRLHCCGEDIVDNSTTAGSKESVEISDDEEDVSVKKLDEQLEASREDFDAVYQLVASFESELESTFETEDGGDRYRDVFWGYYEPVTEVLDTAVQQGGSDVLTDFTRAYDPKSDPEIPQVTPVIENVVGRNLIRTRLTGEVSSIPTELLTYIEDVVEYGGDTDDVALEESHPYGWAIGHPDHDVAGRLKESVTSETIWVQASLEHAFYADQHQAVELFESIVLEDTVDDWLPGGSLPRYMIDCVSYLDKEDYYRMIPRYWDWQDEMDYSFEWDEDVEQRVRDVVNRSDVDVEISEDQGFRELAV